MRGWLRMATAVAVLAGCCAEGLCYPASPGDLRRGVEQSDVIVAGRIERVGEGETCARSTIGSRRFGGPVTVLMHAASLRVELVLEGRDRVHDGIVGFQFATVDPTRLAFIRLQEYEVGERWLMFLKEHEGVLGPLDQIGGQDLKLPADLVLPPQLEGAVLEQGERLWSALLGYQEEDFVLCCLGYVRSGTAFEDLGDGHVWGEPVHAAYRHLVTTPELKNALVDLLGSESPRVRLGAAAVLCRIDYVPALSVFVETAESLPAQAQVGIGAGDAIGCITDPRALPQLHELLKHSWPEFRRSATSALRNIADPSSIPHLVNALGDGDEEVRYFAATALANATGNTVLYLSGGALEQNEAWIIAFWKRWYSLHPGTYRGEGRCTVDLAVEPEVVRLDQTRRVKITATARRPDGGAEEGPLTLLTVFGEFVESGLPRLDRELRDGKVHATVDLSECKTPLPVPLVVEAFKDAALVGSVEITTRTPTYIGVAHYPSFLLAGGEGEFRIVATVLDEDLHGIQDIPVLFDVKRPHGARLEQTWVRTDPHGRAEIAVPGADRPGEAVVRVKAKVTDPFGSRWVHLPYLEGRPEMIAFDELADACNMTVVWDESKRRSAATYFPDEWPEGRLPAAFEVTVGERMAKHGGQDFTLSTPPVMENGRLLVPTEMMDMLLTRLAYSPIHAAPAGIVSRAARRWGPEVEVDVPAEFVSQGKLSADAGAEVPIRFGIRWPKGEPYEGDVEIVVPSGGVVLLGSETYPGATLRLRTRPQEGVVETKLRVLYPPAEPIRAWVRLGAGPAYPPTDRTTEFWIPSASH